MITYLDKIQYLHPGIQGVMQWNTDEEGNAVGYEGIVWENTEIPKPSKEELDAIPDAAVQAAIDVNNAAALLASRFENDGVKAGYMITKTANPSLTKQQYLDMLDAE